MDLSHLLNGNNSDTTFNLNDEFKLHSTFLPNYNEYVKPYVLSYEIY